MHCRIDADAKRQPNVAMMTTAQPPDPISGRPSGAGPQPTLDEAEVARFGAIAAEWWDPHGKFRPLHQLAPARLAFVRDQIANHFQRQTGGMKPLKGLTILDLGCGGGLISEPLSRMGGLVTGIDPSPETIAAARAHAETQYLDIDYRAARAEDLAAAGTRFDAVVCLEVVEHVPDVAAFVALAASLVRPGGLLVLSTLNRTAKAYAMAIVAAEYVLRWLPRGTHQWERFIKPDELQAHITAAGLVPGRAEGLVYNPLRDSWHLADDLDVNYLIAAAKPE